MATTRREWAEEFYSEHFQLPRASSDGEVNVKCPFHDDRRESLSVNLNTGLWCCHAGCGGGDELDFFQKIHNCGYREALDNVTSKHGVRPDRAPQPGRGSNEEPPPRPTVPHQLVQTWHDTLMRAPKVLNFLLNKRGLLPETLRKFQLGWDVERVTIPVFDKDGTCINVRRYSASAKGGNKMLNFKVGYGDATLYPVQNLEAEDVLLCEGEMDCILACQMGFNALTATGGAGTWRDEWNELLRDKNVVIAYDVDDAGITGADKVARKLMPITKMVKVLRLPINDIPHGDITNYFVDLGHTKEDLDKLIAATLSYRHELERPKEDTTVYEVHLAQASNAKYNGKHIKMNTIVAGKDLAPYIVPKKVKVLCPCDTKKCILCGLGNHNGCYTLEFDKEDRTLLQMMDCTDTQQLGVLREALGIPKGCQSYDLTVEASHNVEEVTLIPELDFSSQEHEYVVRKAYYVGHGVSANASYVVEGMTVPDPWSQYSTHVLKDFTPAQDNITTFTMSPEKRKRLSIFQVAPGGTVKGKFDEIHDDLTHNITHIYGRNDVLTAIDLVYHSVLAFDFQGKRIHRGWNECLILGDTRTGKSESVHALMNHYKLGELVTAENTSYAGLIGGMQQTQKRWSITWGKIPLNDRRLVIIDEVSGLSLDAIGNMSGVRSSGVAEITKIQTERTHARTRLIWISNTREGAPLSRFGFGVEAVAELIGKSEDVARFEFVVTCASEEVPMELINRKLDMHGKVSHRFTYDLCKDLVLWAWSRQPDQIEFEDAAIDLILQRATEMGREYSSTIPLVEGANQRIKLARLALAAAARVFSCDETGEVLVVKPEHVDFAFDYLNEVFRKPSLGYWDYSQQIIEQQRAAEQAKDKVIRFLTQTPQMGNVFLQHRCVSGQDLEDMCDLDRSSVRRCLQFLAKAGMISKSHHGYSKTPAFINILRQWKSYGGGAYTACDGGMESHESGRDNSGSPSDGPGEVQPGV
jgi:hypothetical protein